MNRLENKVALVTSGNSGIGYATAEALIAQGAKVIITGRQEGAVGTAAKKIGAIGIVADQSVIKSTDELAEKVESLYGKIDILILNAGMALFSSIDHVREEEYDKIMNTNLKGVFFTLQSFLPILNEGAAVTFVSSYSAYNGSPNSIVYGASKAGLNSMARTAAGELASPKISVNAVYPGMIETPVFSKLGFPEEMIQHMKGSLLPKISLKRTGSPAEVASLLVFLSSAIVKSQEINITPPDKKFLAKVFQILEKKKSDPSFGTEAFLKELGISRTLLHVKLKALTGQSTTEVIRTFRLKYAAQLIEKNFGNISEVAYEAGFNDQSYFTKSFKSYFGAAPSDYLKKVKDGAQT